MQLIPAIDLKEGRCVRLFQGRFDQETRYDVDPVELARRYHRAGAEWLHVVDLDGARNGKPGNSDSIRRILDATGLSVQVGGGIRDEQALEELFAAGAKRAVIGSLALSEPERVGAWMRRFGAERIVLALDVQVDGDSVEIVTHGWTRGSQRQLWDVLEQYRPAGLRHLLCTDVARDGAMQGPNVALYAACHERHPELAVQASGGVRHAEDLHALAAAGAAGAVSGKALLDGAMRLEDLAAFLPAAGVTVGTSSASLNLSANPGTSSPADSSAPDPSTKPPATSPATEGER